MDEAALLGDLIARATAEDGVSPLNEVGRRALREIDTDPDAFKVLHAAGKPVGCAYLDGQSAQLVVDPRYRRRGYGGELARRCLAGCAQRQFWSFGALAPAAALAAQFNLEISRELLIMGRPLTPRAPTQLPAGLTIRSYRPTDRADLLRINADAFAQHEEQGAMDSTDLAARMAEDWFDPEGLLIAEQGGVVVGFHWTKQHSATLGEVYVIAVGPRAQGGGVGKALLGAGLDHLADQEITEVILWVEAAETVPVALYERSGFTVIHRDLVYARPVAVEASRTPEETTA